MRNALAIVLATIAVGLAGCGDDEGGGAEDRTTVLASFYPLAELAERVGGDAVEVTNLTPAGTEPHDLELSTDDVDRIEDADLVLWIGDGFQPALEDAVGSRDGPSLDLLDAAATDGDDPHFWLDPTLLADAVDEVEAALADVVPESDSTFAADADAYRRELDALDEEVGDRLADCERRDLVTSHAAFGYLAERYGLRQRAIAGISPEAEPDPARLDELADFVAANDVTTVFSETLVSPEVAETLAREADVETAVLDPIEGLDDDRLDAGDDYATVMRENAVVLAEALGCG